MEGGIPVIRAGCIISGAPQPRLEREQPYLPGRDVMETDAQGHVCMCIQQAQHGLRAVGVGVSCICQHLVTITLSL